MTASRAPGGMFVAESGSPGAPAILFIHGAGQSGREWRGHMAALGAFHCLAPDLPGHGRSGRVPLLSQEQLADDLAALIVARVPARRAHVVGISWDAYLAQVLVRRHPERVDRVVSDGTPLVWPGGMVGALALGLYAVLVPLLHTRPVIALYRDIADAEDLRLASRRAYWRAVRQCSARAPATAGTPCPTLLVAGEKEGSFRAPDAALAALMPHAEAWYAPGMGHCWQRRHPEMHIRMVEAWCTGREMPSELRREPMPEAEAVEQMRRRVAAAI